MDQINWSVLVKDFRRLNGLKQEAAAELLGVRQATLSRWESGIAAPTIAMQRKLWELFQTSAQRPSLDRAASLEATCMANAAVYRRDEGRLRSFLSSGLDPNQGDYDSRTPLHISSSEGYTELVILLLASGADPTARDRWGRSPMDDAEAEGHLELLDMLKAKSASSETLD
ncbi:MAG: helix-turn-helix domain-containing protein [Pseudomonadota bacterium]